MSGLFVVRLCTVGVRPVLSHFAELRLAWLRAVLCIVLIFAGLCGCEEHKPAPVGPLNPEAPVAVTLWSYGGETMQVKINALFAEFNATVGREKGVVVRGVFYSTPGNLVRDLVVAARGDVGARHMPDMFCSYPNNALRIDRITPLVDYKTVFTPEERKAFVPAFVDYGTVNAKWVLMPVSKSTEALYLNATDWEPFSANTGYSLEDLRTWEGVTRVAAAYNEWTNAGNREKNGGQGFFSIDYSFHFLLMASKQLGHPLFEQREGVVRLQFDRTLARRVWQTMHVPSVKGHFRNDFGYTVFNVAQGVNIAGITSTAFGGMQFPSRVTQPDTMPYRIECLVLPYPVFENGKPFAPLRGGQDIAMVQGDAAKEAACIEFLRWFAEPERNLRLTVPLGYLPVKEAALTPEKTLPLSAEVDNPAAKASLKAAWGMVATHTLYDSEPFVGNVELEEFFDRILPAKINDDLETLARRTAKGEPRAGVLAELTSPEAFERWYTAIVQEAEHVLARAHHEWNN